MLLLTLSLFFSEPVAPEMPRVDAYLVSESDGTQRLEEMSERMDLWSFHALTGRWVDRDSRVFTLADLAVAPPAGGDQPVFVTRRAYAGSIEKFELFRDRMPRPERSFVRAVSLLSPIAVSPPRPIENLPRGYRAVEYWQGTNRSALVATYLPEKSPCWRMATWQLAEGDDIEEMEKIFETRFLQREDDGLNRRAPRIPDPSRSERDLFKEDLRLSVTNYPAWRVTEAPDFMVLDNLPRTSGFVCSLTNELSVMRAKYRSTIPSPLDYSGSVSTFRIHSSRDGYLEGLLLEGITNIFWSAAYWCQSRRELAAYMPPEGDHRLLRTMRHEAFHQYLSYATSMIPASPWFNEGYAQYFERDDGGDWGMEIPPSPEWIENAARMLPALMKMDYGEFYSGTDEERRVKYRLAWSLAYFIEKGAPEVRFNPFKNLKRDYIAGLLKYRDMHKATEAAFAGAEALEDFIGEWKKFWRNR